jgi:predicted amidophosphoribosyltransferase
METVTHYEKRTLHEERDSEDHLCKYCRGEIDQMGKDLSVDSCLDCFNKYDNKHGTCCHCGKELNDTEDVFFVDYCFGCKGEAAPGSGLYRLDPAKMREDLDRP